MVRGDDKVGFGLMQGPKAEEDKSPSEHSGTAM